MQVIVKQKLQFTSKDGTKVHVTQSPTVGIQEAPDFIVEDPYYHANKSAGKLIVIGEEPHYEVAEKAGDEIGPEIPSSLLPLVKANEVPAAPTTVVVPKEPVKVATPVAPVTPPAAPVTETPKEPVKSDVAPATT